MRTAFFVFLVACGGAVHVDDDAAVTPDAAQDVAIVEAASDAPVDVALEAEASTLPACDFDAGCAAGDLCCASSQAFTCGALDGALGWLAYDAAACP